MKDERHAITARIENTDYAEVQRIAKKRKMSEAHVLRMLVGLGLEAHRGAESIGIVGIVDLAYYVKEAIKTKASTGRQLTLPTI